jgi:hypothetical protein
MGYNSAFKGLMTDIRGYWYREQQYELHRKEAKMVQVQNVRWHIRKYEHLQESYI